MCFEHRARFVQACTQAPVLLRHGLGATASHRQPAALNSLGFAFPAQSALKALGRRARGKSAVRLLASRR
jgi:hypothetical protein